MHTALGEVLDAGRGQVIVGSQLTPPTSLVAELVCTAVLSVVRSRMLAERDEPLIDLAPSMMDGIIEPYFGAGAEIADRLRDPLLPKRVASEAKILPLRAHPRVLLALRVIGANAGVSTRGVEQQVTAERQRGSELSQVLKPLEQRGVIENTRPVGVTHEANAWRLTAYGQRALELLGIDAGVTHARQAHTESHLRHPSGASRSPVGQVHRRAA